MTLLVGGHYRKLVQITVECSCLHISSPSTISMLETGLELYCQPDRVRVCFIVVVASLLMLVM
jgi:hypothetical protein